MQIEVPRDREGAFEPHLIPKHGRTFEGFDDQILSMYARGMTTRDIQKHVRELYGVDISPDMVSRVTDSIKAELDAWRNRPLERVYPIVYIDAIVAKTREKGCVQNRPIYLAVGVDVEGRKNLLGMWMQGSEGAKYWLGVLTELKQRGLEDVFVLCADGLSGLPEAVEATFPQTIFQTCIVHLIRASMRYVSYKDRKYLCGRLKEVYTAPSAEAATRKLLELDAELGESFPTVLRPWLQRESEWTPFLEFPNEIRRVIYTTNTIEALNRFVRKALKTRGHLPSDEAAMKLVYLAAEDAKKTWGRATRDWGKAMAQFAIMFEGRVPLE
jgi:transposase-like protein